MSGMENKVRRSKRISRKFPILLIGSDAEGKVFTEETNTVMLSQHGAGIASKHKLLAQQKFVMVLQQQAAKREVAVRVVGEIGQQEDTHIYGVAFLDNNLAFWQEELPEAAPWQERPEELVLECSGCKGVAQIANGDYEYDICAIHGGLVRFCDTCGTLQVWKHLPNGLPTGPSKEAGAEITPSKPTERRAHVRTKVKYFGCVHSQEFGEEIVMCLDMSQGGVSFHCRNSYEKGTQLRLAVPYAPEAKGSPALFVRGTVTYLKEIPGEEVYRCGVQFSLSEAGVES